MNHYCQAADVFVVVDQATDLMIGQKADLVDLAELVVDSPEYLAVVANSAVFGVAVPAFAVGVLVDFAAPV